MSELEHGEEVMIDPCHPFFGGMMGVFEFMMGKEDEIAVFSKPRRSEDEVKIYFMIRPQDEYNNMKYLMGEAEERRIVAENEATDDRICRWLAEAQSPLNTTVIDT